MRKVVIGSLMLMALLVGVTQQQVKGQNSNTTAVESCQEFRLVGESYTCVKSSITTPRNLAERSQYDASYCQGKKNEMTSRGNEWLREWSTATSDPNGRIRTDGKQLASEIGLTLVNCETSLSDHDKLTLTQMTVVINNSIDKDINYGPPCVPYCARGPPIT
jgi:hypothetical protein